MLNRCVFCFINEKILTKSASEILESLRSKQLSSTLRALVMRINLSSVKDHRVYIVCITFLCKYFANFFKVVLFFSVVLTESKLSLHLSGLNIYIFKPGQIR